MKLATETPGMEAHRTGRYGVARVTGQREGQGGLSATVGAHEGVYATRFDAKVDAFENLVRCDAGPQARDMKSALFAH